MKLKQIEKNKVNSDFLKQKKKLLILLVNLINLKQKNNLLLLNINNETNELLFDLIKNKDELH